jgi:hypothetical protein
MMSWDRHGATPSMKDKSARTPLDHALARGPISDEELMRVLSHGSNGAQSRQ